MPQVHVLWLLLSHVLVHSLVLAPAVSETARAPTPDCHSNSMCGDVTIPYPFGLSEACSWDESFTLSCNHSFSPPRPYYSNIEVINITVETGEMRVFTGVSRICFNSSTNVSDEHSWWFNFTGTPFLVTPVRNEFTGIGCHTLALLRGKEDDSYFSGCVTTCTSLDEAESAGNSNGCTGLGCCQILTPSNLNKIEVEWRVRTNRAWKYSPCSYAMVAEKGWYKFNLTDLTGTGDKAYDVEIGERKAPMVLDWAIDSSTSRDGACVSSNSNHVSVREGKGYLCNCSKGYTGNPYVKDGCTNINECLYPETNDCPSGSKCVDTDGGYKCQCNLFQRGEECRPIIPMSVVAILGTFVAMFFLVLLLWFIFKDRKRRAKMACFDKNGGEVLKEAAGIVIFTEVQLKKITKNYKTLLGKGAFGTVYFGRTDDNKPVAVKRSHFEEKKGGQHQQRGDFVNEIIFQLQIDHPNLVRIVGCCLETNIPVLVYDYICNGSLYNLLHVQRDNKVLMLPRRLDIAIGSAEALAYMHSHGDRDRIHGDVKSANILLGENLKPKVSDFGSSKLLSIGSYARAVPADMSYIDPVYMKTHQFVAKSDVYSFSIVLLELITRKTVNYGEDKINSLPMDFVKSCKEKGNAREMYDSDILSHDGGAHQCNHCLECLDKIGDLAIRCLRFDVDERPTMAEVVNELKKAAELIDKCKQVATVTA